LHFSRNLLSVTLLETIEKKFRLKGRFRKTQTLERTQKIHSVKVKELMKTPKPMLWYYRISGVQNEGKLKEN
jgi:hypothetical protein